MAEPVKENKIRTIWKSGGAVINGWLGIPSSVAAENMAQANWDGLTVDLQHGLVDYQAAVTMMQAISTVGTPTMCRVAWLEPGIIMKLLDAGAFGIVCPMINTRDECERFVGACRYPPRGYRSFGPVRAQWTYGADYFKNSNDSVITMAMIETKQAVENLEDILTVPGLDSIYIGPNDLAISYGYGPSGVPTDKEVLDFAGVAVGQPLECVHLHPPALVAVALLRVVLPHHLIGLRVDLDQVRHARLEQHVAVGEQVQVVEVVGSVLPEHLARRVDDCDAPGRIVGCEDAPAVRGFGGGDGAEAE